MEFNSGFKGLTQCSVPSIKVSAIAVHAATVIALCHFQFSVAVNKCLGRHRENWMQQFNLTTPHLPGLQTSYIHGVLFYRFH